MSKRYSYNLVVFLLISGGAPLCILTTARCFWQLFLWVEGVFVPSTFSCNSWHGWCHGVGIPAADFRRVSSCPAWSASSWHHYSSCRGRGVRCLRSRWRHAYPDSTSRSSSAVRSTSHSNNNPTAARANNNNNNNNNKPTYTLSNLNLHIESFYTHCWILYCFLIILIFFFFFLFHKTLNLTANHVMT